MSDTEYSVITSDVIKSFNCTCIFIRIKPVLRGHSLKDQKLVFKTNYCLMQVKSIAECFPLEHSAIF